MRAAVSSCELEGGFRRGWRAGAAEGSRQGWTDKDVQIRGTVQPMHGRAGMVLRHTRQIRGGPPKFKANPGQLRGFADDEQLAPIGDPNLRSQGVDRACIKSQDQQPADEKAQSGG
jgi:hypothetical protein